MKKNVKKGLTLKNKSDIISKLSHETALNNSNISFLLLIRENAEKEKMKKSC